MELTITEKKILEYITLCDEINIKDIAKHSKISAPLVLYYLQKLEKCKVILEYKTVFNQDKDFTTYLLFFRLNNDKELFVKRIQEILKQEIRYASSYFGRYEILLSIKLATKKEYSNLLKTIFESAGDLIAEYITLTEVEGTIYNTPFNKINFRKQANYQDTDFCKKDKNSSKVIQNLHQDSNISIRELAKKAKLSYPTALAKIKELKKRKIVIGKKARIDYGKLGYNQYLVLLNVSPVTISTLKTIAEGNNAVTRFAIMIGEYNCLIEFIAQKQSDTEIFLNTIRTALKRNLLNYTILNKIGQIVE